MPDAFTIALVLFVSPPVILPDVLSVPLLLNGFDSTSVPPLLNVPVASALLIVFAVMDPFGPFTLTKALLVSVVTPFIAPLIVSVAASEPPVAPFRNALSRASVSPSFTVKVPAARLATGPEIAPAAVTVPKLVRPSKVLPVLV